MKFEIELQKAQARGEDRGEARGEKIGEARGMKIGEMSSSLKAAKKMLKIYNIKYISNFVEIPIEYVQALADGCSVETIMEQHFGGDY